MRDQGGYFDGLAQAGQVRLGRGRTGLLRGQVAGRWVDLGRAPRLGSWRRDLNTGEVRCSKELCEILGIGERFDVGRDLLGERVHPADRALVQSTLDRAIHNEVAFGFEARVVRFDGPTRMVRARGVCLLDDAGEPSALAAAIEDVTEELDARFVYELLRGLVESSQDAIVTKDRAGRITSWNRAAEVLYGYSAQEAVGQPIAILEPPERQGEQQAITRKVFQGRSVDQLETERVRKDGQRVAVSLTVSPVRDASRSIVLAAIIARDISERKRYEERLQHLADHDQLTGLLNRHRFEEELKRELARAGRHGTPGAVLSLDLDNFKQLNDSAGHAAGDAVLIEVAQVLKQRFRACDAIARTGGDEFAVFLPDVNEDQARAAANDLRGALATLVRPAFGGRILRVAASIGVAAFQGDDATSEEVLVHADLAMYAAKSEGGDGVLLYSTRQGQEARALMRQPWSERIQDALQNDRFVLHLQPILELASDQLKHGELLLRMLDGRGEPVAPGAFLPIAERHGLIRQIDRWVVRRAIELVGSPGPLPLERVSVNLSAESVARDPDLLGLIEHELLQAQVDPHRLIFEITETAAIANMPEAVRFATGLQQLGCSLALDDFGTGFGSFYYLKHLPVAYVKLDGEFIHNLPRSPVDEHVVRAIVGVAQALGIKTVAESVTDQDTVEQLRELGVDYAQGFYIRQPEPIS